MDHQATLNGAPVRESAPRALTDNVAGVALDILKIAELQGQLFVVDLRALRQAVLWGLGLWVAAGGLLLATLTAALIGMGFWLADVSSTSTAFGLFCVVLAAILLVLVLLFAGWRHLRSQEAGLQRSKTELHNNLTAIRQILSRHTGRNAAD